jgi:hypothetical protein
VNAGVGVGGRGDEREAGDVSEEVRDGGSEEEVAGRDDDHDVDYGFDDGLVGVDDAGLTADTGTAVDH